MGTSLVWDHSAFSVVLSGMSNKAQVVENVMSAKESKPENLTVAQLELIAKIKQKYKKLGFTQCTGCLYGMPCPEGVNIPQRGSIA